MSGIEIMKSARNEGSCRTYILLAPEWINAYAQAVIRTLRSAHEKTRRD